LCLGWISLIAISLLTFWRIEMMFKGRIILSRKLYHFLIVLIAVPGALLDFKFLALSFVVAFAVFLFCELIRAAQVSKLSTMLHQFMSIYVDSQQEPALAGRDCGLVILAHIYLLVGCALPLWLHIPFMSADNPETIIPSLAGVVALGICDSIAAFFGVMFGSIRWPGSNRTVQGSLAAFISAVLSLVLLQYLLTGGYSVVSRLMIPAMILSGLEASLDQVDNLFLPLFFYSSINAI
jgi:dolichol kinase